MSLLLGELIFWKLFMVLQIKFFILIWTADEKKKFISFLKVDVNFVIIWPYLILLNSIGIKLMHSRVKGLIWLSPYKRGTWQVFSPFKIN